MTSTSSSHGHITGPREDRTITFIRHYSASPEAVWTALTDPAHLKIWLAPASIEPRVGGTVAIRFPNDGGEVNGEVLAWEPHTRLEYTWRFIGEPETKLRFELTPEGDGTTVQLTHSGFRLATAPLYGAGWHLYLDDLDAELLHGTTPGEWGARFVAVSPSYSTRFGEDSLTVVPVVALLDSR
jgi:uncharacterized protein YndB with AHSA1/START domain